LDSGTLASITEYGTKAPFGRMLVVPQLIPHMILSVGALASQGCKIEFNITYARVLSPIGKEMILAQRSASNLYYVSRMMTKSFVSTQLLLPNVRYPVQCCVREADLIDNKIESKSTIRGDNIRNINPSYSSTIQQQTDTGSDTIRSCNVRNFLYMKPLSVF